MQLWFLKLKGIGQPSLERVLNSNSNCNRTLIRSNRLEEFVKLQLHSMEDSQWQFEKLEARVSSLTSPNILLATGEY